MKTALILIDVQRGFHDPRRGPRNNPGAEEKIRELLSAFRERGRPVIHVQHLSVEEGSPLRPGREGVDFMEGCEPKRGERIFQKTVNSAFIGTGLEAHLRASGIEEVVLVGFTTDHCVSTSARMAANLGFRVIVISDATVTFARQGAGERYPAELVHEVSLASLRGEFATVCESAGIWDVSSPELWLRGESE